MRRNNCYLMRTFPNLFIMYYYVFLFLWCERMLRFNSKLAVEVELRAATCPPYGTALFFHFTLVIFLDCPPWFQLSHN
jgi:hypothetical protein